MSVAIHGEKCEKCGHEWIPHKDSLLIKCPHCKSPYWKIPREKDKDKDKNK
jgi:predicted Zn-ribbon and HTH transcriptional regulator